MMTHLAVDYDDTFNHSNDMVVHTLPLATPLFIMNINNTPKPSAEFVFH